MCAAINLRVGFRRVKFSLPNILLSWQQPVCSFCSYLIACSCGAKSCLHRKNLSHSKELLS